MQQQHTQNNNEYPRTSEPRLVEEPIVVIGITQQGRDALAEHGCLIIDDGDRSMITMPAGSVRRTFQPIVTQQRNIIVFPDSYGLHEVLLNDGTSSISLFRHAITPLLGGSTQQQHPSPF